MNLRKFVEAMPVPPVMKPGKSKNGIPYYSTTIKETKHNFHPDLPATKVWAFDGEVPGPTFDTKRGQAIDVEWKNDLPHAHFLPVDPTLHGSGESGQLPSQISFQYMSFGQAFSHRKVEAQPFHTKL